jgi:predicted metal-dependent phosphoesterase TrpH
MGKADLHLHSSHSDGMAGVSQLLDHVEAHTDLDVIAVTDHDDIRGSFVARDAHARGSYRFEVVTGMEVTTIEGHLLALFIDEPVPCLRGVEETVAAIHRLGGLAVIPHPLTWLTRGLGARHIRRVMSSNDPGVHFDAIELTNGTPAGRVGARKARALNETLHLAEAGGSDAHFLEAVGAGYTEFPGRTAADLRNAILQRTTRGVCAPHPSLRQIGLAEVARQTYRGIMSTPRAMGWGPTARSFVRRIFPSHRSRSARSGAPMSAPPGPGEAGVER